MANYRYLFFILSIWILGFTACREDEGNALPVDLPSVSIGDAIHQEGDENSVLSFEVTVLGENKSNILLGYSTLDGSARGGIDYIPVFYGELLLLPGNPSKTIKINIIGDENEEPDENFQLLLFNASNAILANDRAVATIIDDDNPVNNNPLVIPATGYVSADNYAGKTLVWTDDFDGTEINEADWNFEIGNGTSGWNNNEEGYYRKENAYLQEGHLIIEAKREPFEGFDYTSARMNTQGNRSFKFGRIDIRAALPEGRGIRPALWMLGNDFPTVGWPTCGEIDIMEIIGSIPGRLHGTVHYGADLANHQGPGSSVALSDGAKFSEAFHVFSIDWQENKIQFLLDDVPYYEFTDADTNGQTYPFNEEFFLLFNVAVGGNWPGSPDASTVFPQRMIVDYIRVFQ